MGLVFHKRPLADKTHLCIGAVGHLVNYETGLDRPESIHKMIIFFFAQLECIKLCLEKNKIQKFDFFQFWRSKFRFPKLENGHILKKVVILKL